MNNRSSFNILKRAIIILVMIVPVASLRAESKVKKEQTVEQELKMVEGEESKNDVKSLKTELLVASSEKKAMEQLTKLLKKYKATAMEPDLLFRLAELYMRQAKTAKFFELNRESDTVVKLAPELAKTTSAKMNVQKAIDTYEGIIAKFPHYSSMDLVLYNDAFARQQISDNKNARRIYNKLIAEYSESPLVPDSHLAIGEMLYIEKDFAGAQKEFEAIKKYPEARSYPYGIYKLAWTDYNLQATELGLKELESVVELSNRSKENGNRFDLRQEALADMVLFFSDVYPSKKAQDYFEKQAGKQEAGIYLLRLAKLYGNHSKYTDQQTVLLSFVDELPYAPERYKAYRDMVDSYDTTKDRKLAVNKLEELSKLCETDSSWSKKQTKTEKPEEDTVLQCKITLDASSLHYASKWHKLWTQNQQESSFGDFAEKAYVIHLKTEDETKPKTDARYAYAELLVKREKYAEASEQYYLVSLKVKDPKILHDASYAAVYSFEKTLKEKLSSKQEERLRLLSQNYTEKNPKGPYVLDIRFRLALYDYQEKRFDKVAGELKSIGDVFAKTEKGLKSQDLYLDILNYQKNYSELKKYSTQLLKDKTLTAERTSELKNIFEESSITDLENREKKGDKSVFDEYQKFAKDNPNSKLADQAWWKSVLILYNQGKLKEAALASTEMHKMFPQSKFNKEALLKSAQTYEVMAKLEESAEVLVLLAGIDTENYYKWVSTAADFYAISSKPEKARKIYTELSKSSDVKVVRSSYEKLWKLEKEFGTEADQLKLVKYIATQNWSPISNQARMELVEKEMKEKNYSTAFKMAGDLLAPSAQSPAEIKARARYVQAQILEVEFVNQSVKAKAERLAVVLAIKTEKLEKVQKAYQDVITYSVAQYAVFSLERLSEIYGQYARDIRSIPAPEGLTAKDINAFKQELEPLAMPMEEKEIDTLVQAIEQARKVNLRDGSMARMQLKLNKLNRVVEQKIVADIKLPPFAQELPMLSGGKCPTKVERESLSSAAVMAQACALNNKWSQVYELSAMMLEQYRESEWGSYFMSLYSEFKKEKSRALWMIDLAIKKNPKQAVLSYQKSRLLWQEAEFNASMTELLKALSQEKLFVEAPLFAAQIYFRDQDFSNAAKYFNQALALKPNDPVALLGLSECMAHKKDLRGALDYTHIGQKYYPKEVLFYALEAQILEMDTKQTPEALKAYRKLDQEMKAGRLKGELTFNLQDKLNYLESTSTGLSQGAGHGVTRGVASKEVRK